ncbi:Coenzyme PQQ synthesis protein E [uncultured archaeon]|nr:Coenzyme PQQ synthesis protein E [uncultured archaeon]
MNHLYLEVTTRCDLMCAHCSVRAHTEDGAESRFDRIIEALASFHSMGGEYLTLSGGEPGLRSDLPTLIDEAHRIGFKITVFTNGRAVSRSVLDAMGRVSGILALSLDGPTASIHEALRGPGTFGPAVNALRRAVRDLGGKHVILSCVLSRPFLVEATRMWEFANREGVGVLYLNIFEPIRQGTRHPLAPETEEMVEPIMQLLDLAEEQSSLRLAFSESDDLLSGRAVFSRRTPEAALGRTIKLQANGWALPGPFYYAPQFRLGRPIEDGWADTLASPVFDFLRRQAERRVSDTIACSKCFWRDRCADGSLALTWATYGRWDRPCPLCQLYHAVLDRAATKEIHRESTVNP